MTTAWQNRIAAAHQAVMFSATIGESVPVTIVSGGTTYTDVQAIIVYRDSEPAYDMHESTERMANAILNPATTTLTQERAGSLGTLLYDGTLWTITHIVSETNTAIRVILKTTTTHQLGNTTAGRS